MKFLIDNALSPVLSNALQAAGYDSKHVRDYQMQAAADVEILARAKIEERIVVSADTDFGTLLSQSGQSTPSAILIRRLGDRHPSKQAAILIANLPALKDDLLAGAVVVIDENRVRIRRLPV
ncbi:DUF5615 family PIN-like protein [bacterium]|nr:DUF5615 family PIN-like protein [bacterium]